MSKQIYIDENGNELLVSGTINTGDMLPISASQSTTMTKSYIDTGLSGKADTSTIVKYFDLTISSTTADSGISPFSYLGSGTKTDANINNIIAVTVYDTQYNNPAIAVFYSVSGSTYTFMVYSARSGNVKIRVCYN